MNIIPNFCFFKLPGVAMATIFLLHGIDWFWCGFISPFFLITNQKVGENNFIYDFFFYQKWFLVKITEIRGIPNISWNSRLRKVGNCLLSFYRLICSIFSHQIKCFLSNIQPIYTRRGLQYQFLVFWKFQVIPGKLNLYFHFSFF